MPSDDASMSGGWTRTETLRALLLVGAAYYGGARLGMALTLDSVPVAQLWPPNAILLAAFLLSPVRAWGLLLLAALPAHLVVELGAGVPLPMVLCWFVSNAAEALLGAVGVRAFVRQPIRFDRLAAVGAFLVFGAALAPFLSSFLDAAFVRWNGWGSSPYWAVWRSRFFSNALAALAIVPFLVAWRAVDVRRWKTLRAGRIAEAALLALSLIVVTHSVFGRTQAGPHTVAALLYVPLPFLLWAAVRFGPRGASASLLLVILGSTWETARGRGPFVSVSPEANVLSLQLLFIVVAGTLLSFAAVLSERERAEASARRRGDALEAEVTERLHAERVTEAENGVLELIARGGRPEDILDRLVAFVETQSPGAIGSIVLLDADGKRIRHGAAPHLPAAYVEAIDGAVIGPRAGSCGTAMHSRKVVVTRDIWTDPLWLDYRELAARHGLAACWSSPILSRQGIVLGSFAVYRREPREPATLERHLVGIATQLASIAIERQHEEREADRQRRELAHLGRAVLLGQLAGTFAHELRQPLTATLADAQAAQRMLARLPDADPELAAILDDIVAATRAASDVIHRLRSMLVKGKPEQAELQLEAVVRGTLQLVRSDPLVRGVRIAVDAAANVPNVRGDGVQLQQVLLNLVMNACEAMGDAAASERVLTIFLREGAHDTVELRVCDRGPGIPRHLADRIFEPFVTSKTGGLGLGLSICRSIVRAHGGRLWAVNRPGGGATFYLVLPAAVCEAAPRAPRPASLARG